MSLLHCPECGHEASANAVACPNCGRPIATPMPVVEKRVIVAQPREEAFPTWAYFMIGIAAIVVLFFGYLMFTRSNDQASTNVNVNMAGRRPGSETVHTSTVPSTGPESVSVPGQTTSVPATATAPAVAPPADKGTVVINARVAPTNGGALAARNTKFYLLDKDLDTILSQARLAPIEGNSLGGSLGLSVVFPDRYGDFYRSAMRAIAAHVKYSGTTSGSGGANIAGIAPNEYYLFAVTKVGQGFALWQSPISVVPGENVLNLSPQSVTPVG